MGPVDGVIQGGNVLKEELPMTRPAYLLVALVISGLAAIPVAVQASSFQTPSAVSEATPIPTGSEHAEKPPLPAAFLRPLAPHSDVPGRKNEGRGNLAPATP